MELGLEIEISLNGIAEHGQVFGRKVGRTDLRCEHQAESVQVFAWWMAAVDWYFLPFQHLPESSYESARKKIPRCKKVTLKIKIYHIKRKFLYEPLTKGDTSLPLTCFGTIGFV